MIVYGALLPHPPLLVPEVGGERLKELDRTLLGVRAVCQNLALSRPELLVLITPHGQSSPYGVTSLIAPSVTGSLARFRAPQVSLGVTIDRELAELAPVVPLAHGELDHGLLVPLYYLREAGVDVPVAIFNPGPEDAGAHHEWGVALGRALAGMDRRVAIVASGDLSHRLTKDGPYGFDEHGPLFDQAVVEALRGRPDAAAVLALSPALVKRAGVCGYKPLAMLLGALPPASSEVFSYEGPLGVGYAAVGLQPDPPVEPAVVALAREAVEAHVNGTEPPRWPRPLPPALARQAAVFVTLRTREGDLRGCVGTVQPLRADLAEEIGAAAVGACSRDKRFKPVTSRELGDLTYSVYVLGPLEPVSGEHELDPAHYGVVVRQGARSGCLLPGIPQITTAARQLEVARQKAAVGQSEPVTLERFVVERYPAVEV